ncbi:MAG: sigma-70 family RNA polymerase sigma factor [Verrucomicrobia bacterium]|nr:sigma-70 family RNA polymerase sigma factor [Verrucomicrobiota bacterium]
MTHRSTDSGASSWTGARFTATRWSIVRACADPASPGAREALEELCRRYWYPLYAYVRRSGHPSHDAEDLVQGFLLRLLDPEFNRLGSAHQEKGRFRSFLMVALKRYLADRWDHAQRKKRGGGTTLVSIDIQDAEGRYLAEPAELEDPARLFDRRWALTVLDRALNRVKEEYAAEGKAERFGLLHPALQGEKLVGGHAAIGRQLGISEGAVAKAAHDLRKRFQALLEAEVAETVEAPQQVKSELRDLLTAIYR